MNLDEIILDFNLKVKEYNKIVNEVVPYYNQMIETIVSFSKFDENKNVKILDLGCGIGNLTYKLLERYNNASITCVDLAENALNVCKSRFPDCRFILSDIRDDIIYDNEEYDLIASNLAIHHLKTLEEKGLVFQKAFKSLSPGGCIVIGDHVQSNRHDEKSKYEKNWIKYMESTTNGDQELINRYYQEYVEKDFPSPLMAQLELLKNIGYSDVDCLWKYLFFSVFIGYKEEDYCAK